MSENYLDDLFDQLVTVEPHPAWNDVLARARRSRRRYGALVAAVAVFVLVPAAWAVNGAFTAPPPPQVQAAAAAWNRLLPQMLQAAARDGYTPTDAVPVDLSKLHGLEQVQTPDGHLDVWGGPSSDGGHLCWLMAFETDLAPGSRNGPDGGCTQPGGLANNYNLEVESGHPDVYLAYGYTDNANATTALVRLKVGEDMHSTTVPVVDGLYLVASPRDPATTNTWDNVFIEKVVTYDASGNEIETWQNPCATPPGTPCSG